MGRVPDAMCVTIQVMEPVARKRTVAARRPGRVFEVGGMPIKLFPIGVMAEAIDRKQRTIVEWERSKLFPKPMYAVPKSRCVRWYSERQILAANALWLRYREKGKAKHFPVTEFLAELRGFFYTVDVDAAKGLTNG